MTKPVLCVEAKTQRREMLEPVGLLGGLRRQWEIVEYSLENLMFCCKTYVFCCSLWTSNSQMHESQNTQFHCRVLGP